MLMLTATTAWQHIIVVFVRAHHRHCMTCVYRATNAMDYTTMRGLSGHNQWQGMVFSPVTNKLYAPPSFVGDVGSCH